MFKTLYYVGIFTKFICIINDLFWLSISAEKGKEEVFGFLHCNEWPDKHSLSALFCFLFIKISIGFVWRRCIYCTGEVWDFTLLGWCNGITVSFQRNIHMQEKYWKQWNHFLNLRYSKVVVIWRAEAIKVLVLLWSLC